MDVTEQEQLTKGLRRREAHLAKAQRLSHTGTFGWNVSTDEHFWSEETFRIFEFAPSSKVSLQMILDRVHPQDMPSVKTAIAAATRRERIDLEHRLLMSDGRIKYLHVVGEAERSETGGIEIIGAVMDVTARKLTEVELRRSKAHLADAQTLSRTGSVGMEGSTKRIFWSDEAARIYGYPPGTEPTPDLILQRVHPADVDLLKRVLERAAQGGSDFDFEHRLQMPDGSIKYVRNLSHYLEDKSGNGEVVGAITDVTERKLAEEAIRQSADYLAEAQRLSHTGSFGWNPLTGEIVWSDETYRIFECELSEKPTLEISFERVHPDDRALVQQVIERATSSGTDFELEHRLLMPSGAIKHIHVRAHALHHSRGEVEFIGAVTDITARKTADEKIREQEAELRQTLDFAPQLIAVFGPNRERLHINRIALDYLGLSLEEWRHTREWDAFVHPDDRAQQRDYFDLSVSTGSAYELELRLRKGDGSYRWFLARSNPVRDDKGQIMRWYVALTDIESRKQAEEIVRRSEEELRQLIDGIPQQVFVFDSEWNPLFANRRELEYTGLTAYEARSKEAVAKLFHPDDLKRLEANRERGSSEVAPFETEARMRGIDGRYRWFLVRDNPSLDEQGHVLRWYGTRTDIEDRKRAEERLRQENVALREEIDKASMFEEIVGTSPALKAALSRISKVAASDATVLITGETGTGKELFARATHRRSNRASRAFVSLNCAAIPRDLIASELFGHEKGAFTGATQQRLGRFELANGGTLFLDEVGELPAETQIALLRVLQEHEFERVGGTRPIRTDVRVIAATNRDLQAAISAGSFRSDLFYRLHVFPLEVPPLRERSQDVPLLVEYFIDRYARKAGKNIRAVDKKSLKLLSSYTWPGNVRELQNIVERSVILCDSDIFSIDENWLLPQMIPTQPTDQPELHQRLQAQEKDMIETALRDSRGKVFGPRGAAAKLRIARSTLESKIRSLKIDKNHFRTSPET